MRQPRIGAGARRSRRTATEIVVIEPGRNLGFAGGVNAALERATWRVDALVNDDCMVEPGGRCRACSRRARRASDIGSVAAQVGFADRPGTINSAGIQVDVLGVATERLLGSPISDERNRADRGLRREWRRGPLPTRMLDDIGGFDESFFAYLEDADVAWRARMAGWRCCTRRGDRAPPPFLLARPRLACEAVPRRPQPRPDAREERDDVASRSPFLWHVGL